MISKTVETVSRLIIRLVAAALIIAAADALLPDTDDKKGGITCAAKRLIALAMFAAVISEVWQ